MNIRTAQEKDVPALLKIYNDEIENGIATWDLQKKTMEEWREWFSHYNTGNHPLVVAEIEGEVAGYASLSSYRPKEAYKSTVELSIYISPQFQGRGIATALMTHIIEEAKRDERTHVVVSVITGGNQPSIKLHEKFGFAHCGTMPEVGYKFGKYLGIVNYCLRV